MPDLAPLYVVAIAAWLLALVATVGLFTDFLGVLQLLAVATVLVTTIVLLLTWSGRRKR
jgi:hypothetical protein